MLSLVLFLLETEALRYTEKSEKNDWPANASIYTQCESHTQCCQITYQLFCSRRPNRNKSLFLELTAVPKGKEAKGRRGLRGDGVRVLVCCLGVRVLVACRLGVAQGRWGRLCGLSCQASGSAPGKPPKLPNLNSKLSPLRFEIG